jgi:hypothetical protein
MTLTVELIYIYILELIFFLTENTVCLLYKGHCDIRKYSRFGLKKMSNTHKFCTKKMLSLCVSFNVRLKSVKFNP